ncbi:MAG: hypothetical protein BZ151_02910 [Desulfobacca sp. 4484_104]|nr:MAG: hypothetical protein BZ151_02910 [Desulfobacca sp. 4484_104]RLA89093.1 MAG: hypothetical protein DRG58_06050 [Deltaproteobacteria bacterium]
MTLPRRLLGRYGVEVTILGLGGEGVLRTYGQEREAQPVSLVVIGADSVPPGAGTGGRGPRFSAASALRFYFLMFASF